MSSINKQRAVSLFIILISFLVAFYFYPQVPDQIPIHWNAEGDVDGYGSKEVGLFLMPAISVFLYLLLIYLPKIDPLKKNVDRFRGYYEWTVVVFLLFFFSIHILSILWALGQEIDVRYVMLPGLAVLFYVIGELMEKAKRNWFIGIRTPWTLSSEKVWDKTHKIGAKVFKGYSIFVVLMLVFGMMNVWIIIGPMLLIVLWVYIYSYLEYDKLKKK